ncbi:MAG: N-acetylmuramoyl-L-alanine amidase [Bacteroidales bacterium]|nr:N-acetylmuramoyl-L-alanine amidase [Bacteroidales bacterium]
MKILIDNGHGLNTPGKRSPDGKFIEAIYNREIARRIVADLQDRGYDAELLVPEEKDISLKERVRRVNAACSATPSCPAPTGHPNVILISIHVNAAGDGTQWMNATGWSCYTCKGQTQSDKLADCLCQTAIKNFPGRRIRTDYSDRDPDWEEDFYLLRKSHCVAVLSENFFMDNRSDLEYLQSRSGMQSIIDTHVEGIVEYIDSL